MLNLPIYKGTLYVFFFLSEFSFKDTVDSQDSRRREGTIFYSTLPLPPTHEHSDIYFETLHVRWLSHIFNRTACFYPMRFTALSNYYLIDWWCDVDFTHLSSLLSSYNLSGYLHLFKKHFWDLNCFFVVLDDRGLS